MTTAPNAPRKAEGQGGRRTPPRLLQVVRTTRLSPHMQRITLGGAELIGFPLGKEGSHVKVFLPRPGQSQPALPTLGPQGVQWPAAEERPFVRTYTVRKFRPEPCELDLDFVLHTAGGPAAQWAAHAQPGDWIGIAGPGNRGPIPHDATWYLFAGDESALPAIAAHLELLPRSARGQAWIEVPSAADEQELTAPAGVDITWLHRDRIAAGQLPTLVDAVCAAQLPTADSAFGWVAGETAAVTAIRRWLVEAQNLPRQRVDAVPYWKAGANEETFHDERHTIMDAHAVAQA